jgi:hypothetical protein
MVVVVAVVVVVGSVGSMVSTVSVGNESEGAGNPIERHERFGSVLVGMADGLL